MSVRAKFKCVEKTQSEMGNKIKLQPVTSGSKENDEFFKWTPYGSIEIGTINENAALQFEVGKQYYVDFSETEN